MPEDNSGDSKRQKELETLEERQYEESTVKRALIRYYSKKYKNLPSEERDKKIASALKVKVKDIVPF